MLTLCKDWYAWINRQPGGPASFHLIGGIEVGNPGISVMLTKRHPQGINPAILMLDVGFYQKPGIWPQVMTCASTHYDEVLSGTGPVYTSVEIFQNGAKVDQIDQIDTVS